MIYPPTLEDVRYSFNLDVCSSLVSSVIEESDRDDMFDCLLSKQRGHEYFKMPLLYSFIQYDSSTFFSPHFETDANTSLVKEFTRSVIPEEILEFDAFVKMKPVKERTMRIRIKSVEKAKMHIVEPEGFYGD